MNAIMFSINLRTPLILSQAESLTLCWQWQMGIYRPDPGIRPPVTTLAVQFCSRPWCVSSAITGACLLVTLDSKHKWNRIDKTESLSSSQWICRRMMEQSLVYFGLFTWCIYQLWEQWSPTERLHGGNQQDKSRFWTNSLV